MLTSGPGPLWRTEVGQRALNSAAQATAPAPPAGLEVAKRGNVIPTFSLRNLDRSNVELPAAFKGRPVLINVWASWCGPCITEMPALQAFAKEQGANGVQVVGIALDDVDAVRAFIERTGVTYPILVDAPGPADAGVRLGNPKGVLPYSALISADGRLLKQRIGPFEEGEIAGWAKD
ncbi:MAG: TlpA family protein disulfide reductase [Lysobacter sp.]|nr:TlpA family protein disulfide reductase [Lysobacter sp.]